MNLLSIVFIAVFLIALFYLLNSLYKKRNTLNFSNDAKSQITISSDKLSNNTSFTYSIWLYVENWNDGYGQPKVVLQRAAGTTGFMPQIVLGNTNNTLTVNVLKKSCAIQNIPIQKWVHLLVSVSQKVIDIYVDGKLVKTCVMDTVPVVSNLGDLVLSPGGMGFTGKTAKLEYFANPVDPQTAWNIYKAGNGVSSSSRADTYGINVAITKNDKVQTDVKLF